MKHPSIFIIYKVFYKERNKLHPAQPSYRITVISREVDLETSYDHSYCRVREIFIIGSTCTDIQLWK